MSKRDKKVITVEEKIADLESQVKFADSETVNKARELAAKIRERAEKELASAQSRKVKKFRPQLSEEEKEARRIIAEAREEAKRIREQKQSVIGSNELAVLGNPEYKMIQLANRIKKPINPETDTAKIWNQFFANRSNLTTEVVKGLGVKLNIDYKYAANWGCLMRKMDGMIEAGIIDHSGNLTNLGRQMTSNYKQKLNDAILADQ